MKSEDYGIKTFCQNLQEGEEQGFLMGSNLERVGLLSRKSQNRYTLQEHDQDIKANRILSGVVDYLLRAMAEGGER